MSDDAGWYATYSQFIFRTVDRHFDELEAEIRKSAHGRLVGWRDTC